MLQILSDHEAVYQKYGEHLFYKGSAIRVEKTWAIYDQGGFGGGSNRRRY